MRSKNLTFKCHKLFQYKRERGARGKYGFNLQRHKAPVTRMETGKMTKSNGRLHLGQKNLSMSQSAGGQIKFSPKMPQTALQSISENYILTIK